MTKREEIRIIKGMLMFRFSSEYIKERFGISDAVLSHIRKERRWGEIKAPSFIPEEYYIDYVNYMKTGQVGMV